MRQLARLVGWSLLVAILVGAGFAAAVLTRSVWLPTDKDQPEADRHTHATNRLTVSAAARKNLNLVIEPLVLRTAASPYPRTIPFTGKVIERPGGGDRLIAAPFTAVVNEVAKLPGETVRPGDRLFVLEVKSDYLQETQAKLHKTRLDFEINQREQKRLLEAPEGANLFRAKLVELGYERDRLTAARQSLRQELRARFLPVFADLAKEDERETAVAALLDGIELKGDFLTRLVLKAPQGAAGEGHVYEVEEIPVRLGEQVNAGQPLCRLADHQHLLIEGRAFEQDVPLLQRALQRGWPARADFREGAAAPHWQQLSPGQGPIVDTDRLRLLYLSNRLDPVTRTFRFYLELPNQSQERVRPDTGKRYLMWRFRVDQPVQLSVRVDEFVNVFVVPVDAVVRDGAEAYVFRTRTFQEEGELVLDRIAVHVRYEDSTNTVIEHDGTLAPGQRIAMNAAAHLNRVLRLQAAGGDDHGHHHQH
jgi:multidrug efflux pump subunit AcrA (membrane-fusion protein)